jgi:hypothetical protein
MSADPGFGYDRPQDKITVDASSFDARDLAILISQGATVELRLDKPAVKRALAEVSATARDEILEAVCRKLAEDSNIQYG